jgi:membrane peptidoglycan carboxypeptidase
VQFLKDGHGLNEVVDGSVRPRNEDEFVACGSRLRNRPWNPGNADGGRGFMTVMEATRSSVNNAYLDIGAQLDLCQIMDGAAELGVHKAGGKSGTGPFDAVPANILGSNSVAPLTMAAAFAAFAAEGYFCEPIAILSVVDSEGNQLRVPDANCRQALSPSVAAGVNHALSQVWSGTGARVGGLPGRPSAGKTGTTNRNEYTWFVGYTPQISTAVWVGYPDTMKPVQSVTIAGTRYRYVYGSSIALPTWKRFMVRAHEGLSVKRFAQASGSVLGGQRETVPDVTGLSKNEATRILEEAGFHVDKSTSKEYSDVPKNRVSGTKPGAGSTQIKGTVIRLIISRGSAPAPPPPPDDDDEPPPLFP